MNTLLRATLASAAIALFAANGVAQEAAIRENLPKRIPGLPQIDEVNKSPIAGLYEVRMGTEIIYTDERGEYVLEGSLIETRTRTNLTEERIDKLTAIDFSKLPLKDAIVWKQGSGARKLVVFADPNCGYCKKFETEMQQVKDVTVYTYLVPILGGDSPSKSRDIWCAKNNGSVWREWMIKGVAPQRSMGQCDVTALQRNLEFAKKHRVNSTPSIVFEDGKRVAGAMAPDQVEKQLIVSRGKS